MILKNHFETAPVFYLVDFIIIETLSKNEWAVF